MLFASKNYFCGHTLSRRDDIIQIIYNLVYLLNPPNFRMVKIMESDNVFAAMKSYKVGTSPEKVCSESVLECLRPILSEAYSYGYDEKPQYGKLKFLLEHELLKMHCLPDDAFSWLQPKEIDYIGRPIC